MKIVKKILFGSFDILQTLVKVALIILITFLSFETLNKVFKNDEFNGDKFHSLPEQSMDVIVIGSSHAQYSFNPAFFYQNTGLYSYVLGSACQPLEVSYEMLKEALKTQSPKVVILETYTALPLRSMCEADGCYVMAEYQMSGEEKINTIKYLPEDKAETYLNDFNTYHNDWKTAEDPKALWNEIVDRAKELKYLTVDKLKNLDVSSPLEPSYDIDFGYVYQPGSWGYPSNWWHPETFDDSMKVQLDELDLVSLNNIKALCDENDIKLILYKTPMDGMDEQNMSMLRATWDWATKNEVAYVDFFAEAEALNYYMTMHSDSFHAYISGASKITYRLANEINNGEYEFDHQFNEDLEPVYIESAEDFTTDYLNFEYDPNAYLTHLAHSKGTFAIRYRATGYPVSGVFTEFLERIGVTDVDLSHSFVVIVNNGKVQMDEESLSTTINGHTLEVNNDFIITDGNIINDSESPITVMYGKENMNNCLAKDIEYRSRFWTYGLKSYIR